MDSVNLDQLRADLRSSHLLTCSGAIRAVIDAVPTAESLLPDLYALHRTHSSPAIQSTACAAIRRHKSHAVPFLLGLLASTDPSQRVDAIHLLLGLGHNRSTWGLAYHVLRDRPQSQPEWESHRSEVMDGLTAALDDPDLDVQVTAAVSLDDIGYGPPDLVDRLVKGLASSDIYVRNLSALHLGRLGPSASAALPALQAFVQTHVDDKNDTRRPALAAKKAIVLINGGSPTRGP